MATTDGLEDVLEPGEEVLWQGQPDAQVVWGDLFSVFSLLGLAFSIGALVWMIAATALFGGSDAPFPFNMLWLFGLPFLLVGLYALVGHPIFDARARRHTRFTLTTRRAITATTRSGRAQFQSFPLEAMPYITLSDGTPGSITFGSQSGPQGLGRPIGFPRIENARQVYDQMRRARAELIGTEAEE